NQSTQPSRPSTRQPTQSAQAASQVPAPTSSNTTVQTSNRSTDVHPNGHYNAPLHLANVASIIDPVIPQEFCFQSHANMPFIKYENGVLLDSGATSHMSGDKHLFTDLQPYSAGVLIADGTVSQCTHRGTINVKVFDSKTQKYQLIPLHKALYVPGFCYTLWSVVQFDKEGHGFTFGNNQVRLILNLDSPEEQTIILPPPFSTTPGNTTVSHSAHVAIVSNTVPRGYVFLDEIFQYPAEHITWQFSFAWQRYLPIGECFELFLLHCRDSVLFRIFLTKFERKDLQHWWPVLCKKICENKCFIKSLNQHLKNNPTLTPVPIYASREHPILKSLQSTNYLFNNWFYMHHSCFLSTILRIDHVQHPMFFRSRPMIDSRSNIFFRVHQQHMEPTLKNIVQRNHNLLCYNLTMDDICHITQQPATVVTQHIPELRRHISTYNSHFSFCTSANSFLPIYQADVGNFYDQVPMDISETYEYITGDDVYIYDSDEDSDEVNDDAAPFQQSDDDSNNTTHGALLLLQRILLHHYAEDSDEVNDDDDPFQESDDDSNNTYHRSLLRYSNEDMDTTASETGEDESDDDNDSNPTPMEYAFMARVL
ncbi:MAG: hypothetical protein V2J89_17370, partial [Halieaceae bacterium]|nr:hypothetical protein [Halieaceae bacterium]